jgi:hypothetical protein
MEVFESNVEEVQNGDVARNASTALMFSVET